MSCKCESACERIVRTTSLSELSNVLSESRHEYELAHLVYNARHLPRTEEPNPLLLLTYDAEWVQRYKTQDYFQIDPVIKHGLASLLPLDWSNLESGEADVRAFFREARSFGVGRNGMTIPIRGPHGERALFSLTSNLSAGQWQTTRLAMMRDFMIIAYFFHDQAVRLSGMRDLPGMGRPLSRRERETLQLAARGFAPKQIAADLRVSTTAVRLYLQTARTKLECTTLTQGIAKAISLDLIRA